MSSVAKRSDNFVVKLCLIETFVGQDKKGLSLSLFLAQLRSHTLIQRRKRETVLYNVLQKKMKSFYN